MNQHTYAPGGNPMSAEAYHSIKVNPIEEKIFDYIDNKGSLGATTDEVEAELGLLHQTASPAIIRLRQKGFLSKNGEKRDTRNGRRAEVHVVAA